MKTKQDLQEIKEISTLITYLFIDENNSITFNNGVADLQVNMNENFTFKCINLNFPQLGANDFTEQFTITYILGVIDVLKETPPVCNSFTSRWDEIKTEVGITNTLNTYKGR